MSITVIYTIATLSIIGTSSAVILYFVAQKFKVIEDPRIDQVEEALPSANCGGCGFAGCRAFAEACVKADKLDDLNCPVGGNETMGNVASILGLEAVKKEPRVAYIRCNGTCDNRPKQVLLTVQAHVQLHHRFTVANPIVNTDVLGYGDCVDACDFDAIDLRAGMGVPLILDDKCVACGACVDACPKNLIELTKKIPERQENSCGLPERRQRRGCTKSLFCGLYRL